MNEITLYTLPFAGGNKYSYKKFEEYCPSYLKLINLEYPGRGGRTSESLTSDIGMLVDDMYDQVKDSLGEQQYAIYGHSMGGLVAYLLTQKIISNKQRPPLHLFITGTAGPAASCRGEKKRHLLGRSEFIEEIKSLNGSPEEILQNKELLDYYEPILRADFKASECYAHLPLPPLNIPFTVISGTEEEMLLEEIGLWQHESTYVVDFRTMAGNHFFIFEWTSEILKIISEKLVPYVKFINYAQQ
jgi:surfactin synthase thioesterase subunit